MEKTSVSIRQHWPSEGAVTQERLRHPGQAEAVLTGAIRCS